MLLAPFFLFASIVLLHVLAPDLPSIIRYHLVGVSFVVGLALGGPEAMRNSTYTKEDLLMAYSSLVGVGVFGFGGFHIMYLVDAGILTTDFSALLAYFFSMVYPISVVAVFLAYELLDRRETARTLGFRAKRLFGRAIFGVGYGLAVLFTMHMTTSVLGVTKTAGWLGFIVPSFGLLVLVLGSTRVRQFLNDLIDGTW